MSHWHMHIKHFLKHAHMIITAHLKGEVGKLSSSTWTVLMSHRHTVFHTTACSVSNIQH